MIKILNRWTDTVVYHSKTAQTLSEAVLEYRNWASETNNRVNLQGAHLKGVNLQYADLQGAIFRGADLQHANFQGASLRNTCFADADLRNANFQGADLCWAYFQDANLQNANLRGARLQGAWLEDANFQGANLQETHLRDASLQNANLQDADLRGVDLQGTYLQGANFQGTVGLLPNGIMPFQIGGSRHWIIVRQPGYITIGCFHKPIAWWEKHYATIGRAEGYTADQVAEYRRHIAYCREWMEANGVLTIEQAT